MFGDDDDDAYNLPHTDMKNLGNYKNAKFGQRRMPFNYRTDKSLYPSRHEEEFQRFGGAGRSLGENG